MLQLPCCVIIDQQDNAFISYTTQTHKMFVFYMPQFVISITNWAKIVNKCTPKYKNKSIKAQGKSENYYRISLWVKIDEGWI